MGYGLRVLLGLGDHGCGQDSDGNDLCCCRHELTLARQQDEIEDRTTLDRHSAAERLSIVIDGSIPGRKEVEEELTRMLASAIFSRRPQLAKLFEFLVKAGLNKEEVTESHIQVALYPSPPYKEGSNIVRISVEYIRTAITEYYASDGNGDLVTIGLPRPLRGRLAGEAYKACFSYNPEHESEREFELGAFHSRFKSDNDLLRAACYLMNVLQRTPTHQGALIGCSEVLLAIALIGFADVGLCLESAYQMAANAVQGAPESWRAQSALGTVLLFLRNIEGARQCFEISIKCNEKETLDHTGYHVFLLLTDNQSRAVELLEQRAKSRLTDSYTQVLLGGFYYMLGMQAASYQLAIAGSLGGGWLLHVAKVLLSLDEGTEFGFMGACVSMERAQQYSLGGVVNGLNAICISNRPYLPPEEAATKLSEERERLLQEADDEKDWFSISLCYLAEKNHELAIDMLEEAWKRHDPRIVLISRLPLFAALRAHERFRDLERRSLEPSGN